MYLNQTIVKNVSTLISNRCSKCKQHLAHLHQEHKMVVNGMTINTVQVGDGEKTVMLLPGTLGTAWTSFRPQLEGLPELLPNHKIIAWDPPGYGKSVPPNRGEGTDCFLKDAKCAVNVMRALSRHKFSLLGWSAGGSTALIIAGRFPEYVEKLVIWGAGAYLSKTDFKALEALRDVNNWSKQMLEPLEEVYGRKRLNEMLPTCLNCLKNFYENRNGDICCEETQMIQAPTFLLRGSKDPLNSVEHVSYLMDRLPCCKFFEFPDGKHNIHLRYPEEFNNMVADFLLKNENELNRISRRKHDFNLMSLLGNFIKF